MTDKRILLIKKAFPKMGEPILFVRYNLANISAISLSFLLTSMF